MFVITWCSLLFDFVSRWCGPTTCSRGTMHTPKRQRTKDSGTARHGNPPSVRRDIQRAQLCPIVFSSPASFLDPSTPLLPHTSRSPPVIVHAFSHNTNNPYVPPLLLFSSRLRPLSRHFVFFFSYYDVLHPSTNAQHSRRL